MNNELDKKLAEWAGFQLVPRFGGSLSQATEYLWRCPDGNHFRELPNFTESLDAYFKWLVPKLSFWQIINCRGIWIRAYVWAGEEYEQHGAYKGSGEIAPALALCLAIEKLIDEEVKDVRAQV